MRVSLTRLTALVILGWTCQGSGGCGSSNGETDSACAGCGRAWS